MEVYSLKETKKPPQSQTKAVLWLKENLFSSVSNIALTFIALYLVYLLLPPILNWTIFNANFDLTGVQFDKKVEVAFESNNNLRANVGLRLNITVITIQADYTFAEYPTATLGIGVSLR